MSQSLLYRAFGVREGYEYWRTEYGEGCVRFFLLVDPELLVRPCCQSREVSRKGRWFRELQAVPIRLKPVFLVTEVPKCQLHPPAQSVRRGPARGDDGDGFGRRHEVICPIAASCAARQKRFAEVRGTRARARRR
jgi:hypothetical protein